MSFNPSSGATYLVTFVSGDASHYFFLAGRPDVLLQATLSGFWIILTIFLLQVFFFFHVYSANVFVLLCLFAGAGVTPLRLHSSLIGGSRFCGTGGRSPFEVSDSFFVRFLVSFSAPGTTVLLRIIGMVVCFLSLYTFILLSLFFRATLRTPQHLSFRTRSVALQHSPLSLVVRSRRRVSDKYIISVSLLCFGLPLIMFKG